MFRLGIRARQQTCCFLEPLAVLHGLGGADHGKRLVCGEHAVSPGEGVALQPAVAIVLGQHLRHAAID